MKTTIKIPFSSFFTMSYSSQLFILIFFLNIFNPLFNAFLRGVGLWGWFTILRDGLIMLMVLICLIQRQVNKRIAVSLVLFILFVFYYLLQSILQHRLDEGLYYLRAYIIPYLFLFSATFLFEHIESDHLQVSKIIIRISILTALVAILIVSLFYVNREAVLNLFTLRDISGSWFLHRTMIFRAGWPIGGPNKLGLLSASNIIFLLSAGKDNLPNIRKRLFNLALLLNAIVLILTFSRSSWLFMLGYSFLFVLIKLNDNKFLRKILVGSTMISILLVYLVSSHFEKVKTWLISTFSFNELSSFGHFVSIVDSLKKIDEYFLFGYPKGTVGPRAIFFTDAKEHAENAFIVSMMDFGIFGFLLYYSSLFFMFSYLIRTYRQFLYVFALILPFMLLPYSQDIEVLIMLSSFLCCLGLIKKRYE